MLGAVLFGLAVVFVQLCLLHALGGRGRVGLANWPKAAVALKDNLLHPGHSGSHRR